jgi:hypothetical protein
MATSTSSDRVTRIFTTVARYVTDLVTRRWTRGHSENIPPSEEAFLDELENASPDGDDDQLPPIRRYPITGNAEQIESALQELGVVQLLIVDTAGQVHTDKAPFATCEAEPLVSFVRSIDGGFTVYAGVPASNKTFCGSGVQPASRYLQSGDFQPLRYDGIVLNSGDWLSLAHGVFVPIPSQRVPESNDPGLRLSRQLASARRGDRVYLGRLTEPDCPEYVSRVHVTAHILSRIDRKDGTFSMQVRIIRGVAAGRHVAVIGIGGREQPILGSLRLQPGNRLALGNGLGEIVLPPMADSPDRGISDAYTTLTRRKESSSEDADALFDNERDRVRMLECHIKKGLLLVSRHALTEAIAHFMRVDVLQALGVSLSDGNLVFLKELSPSALTKSLDRIRAGTIYNPESRYIIVGRGALAPGVSARDAEEERLLADWYRAVATIYASVFTKALKHISGRMAWISLRGELIATQALSQEIDIAAYIEEHGVWLDKVNFGDAQLDILEGIERLRGYQFTSEQERFSKKLRQLSFDNVLVVGRGARRDEDTSDPYFFTVPLDVELAEARGGYERLYRRRNALAQLQEREVSIKKCTDGSYLLSPLPGSTVFVPDTSGRYQRLMQARHISPQTPISLGGTYILTVE